MLLQRAPKSRTGSQWCNYKALVLAIFSLTVLGVLYVRESTFSSHHWINNIHLKHLRPLYFKNKTNVTKVHNSTSPLALKLVDLNDSVLSIDYSTVNNAVAHMQGARSSVNSLTLKTTLLDATMDGYVSQPMVATVDLRPATVWQQLTEEGANPELLGCAFSTNTMFSPISQIWIPSFTEKAASASLCFEMSNPELASQWFPHAVIESASAACVPASSIRTHARFAYWQQKTMASRPENTAYPFSLDFHLPNNELAYTCREITTLYENLSVNDDIKGIYIRVGFKLMQRSGKKEWFEVTSRWPWSAVSTVSRDDRRSIGHNKPNNATDTSSDLIPSSPAEIKLAFTEGPVFERVTVDGQAFLKSSSIKDSHGGAHPRLVTNLLHQGRVAPNSTRLIGVLDGQVLATKRRILEILDLPITSIVHPESEESHALYSKNDRISGSVRDFMTRHGITIKIVALATASLSFRENLVGGQYAFSSYVLARYASEYHLMTYLDGDATLLEGPNILDSSNILKELLYRKMYDGPKCVAQRFHLVEHSVPSQIASSDAYVYECVAELASKNVSTWTNVATACDIHYGNTVARADAALIFDVHYVTADISTAPVGLQDCEPDKEKFFIPNDEFVEVHLTSKDREAQCTCGGSDDGYDEP